MGVFVQRNTSSVQQAVYITHALQESTGIQDALNDRLTEGLA